ncbi:TIGR03089 family protein [Actinoplanes subglobosus]|uniref:TIGR03089 family protein n=1 Tax=Actinoplanes subglobosus TaxID=1547892 RepID=A0ABV8J832_9ACTN
MNDQLITFYDDATGERTGLTASELGEWVSATVDLLTAGCGLRRGDRAGVLLPPHWQTATVLLGAWAAGIEVSFRSWAAAGLSPDTGPALDVTFVERRRVGSWLEDVPPAGHQFVLGLAPDGGATSDVPPGYLDFAPAARARLGAPPPPQRVEAGAAATVDGTTFGEYGAAAAVVATARGIEPGDRILVDTAACEEPLIWLMAPLTAGASIVLCANLDPSRLDERIGTEGVTRLL